MKYALALILALVSPLAFGAVNLSIEGLVEVIVYLIVIGGVFWLLLFLIGYIGLPEPFAKVAKIILMVVGVLLLINILLGFVGHPMVNWR